MINYFNLESGTNQQENAGPIQILIFTETNLLLIQNFEEVKFDTELSKIKQYEIHELDTDLYGLLIVGAQGREKGCLVQSCFYKLKVIYEFMQM